MSVTGLPFDDFRALLAAMPGPAASSSYAPGLGRLGEVASFLAAWRGPAPAIRRPFVAVFAGAHGHRGTAGSRETGTQVEAIAAGGAALSGTCATFDLGLKVFDLALEVPTGHIAREAALDERSCAATMAFGMEALVGEPDLLCLGAIGAGGKVTAAALAAALFGGAGADWTDGAEGAALVDAALHHHSGHLRDPFEALRRVGGREIAALCGAILAARTGRVPVILDGLVPSLAAGVLHRLEPSALDHCLFAHASLEPGHARLLAKIGARPLLSLDLATSEGLGAALAAGLVRAAVASAASAAAS